jgi:single-strand DNA-binding protein
MKDLKKGDPVLVQGRLVNEAWTDREGQKRNSTKVEATRVEALSRGAATGSAAATPAGPRTQTASSPARPQPTSAGASRAQGSRAATTGTRSGGLDIDQGLDDFPPEEEDLPF